MERNRVKKEIFSWLRHIGLAVIITLTIIDFVGQFTIVLGNSMNPTLQNNDIVVIEKITRHFGQLKQGDVVILKIPELLSDGKTYAVKRIIAMGGQRISIREGSVYVNEVKLEEPYINGEETLITPGVHDDMTVPEGYIYVLGDNRIPNASRDSRTFGPVEAEKVVGRVVFRLFPISEMGVVK